MIPQATRRMPASKPQEKEWTNRASSTRSQALRKKAYRTFAANNVAKCSVSAGAVFHFPGLLLSAALGLGASTATQRCRRWPS